LTTLNTNYKKNKIALFIKKTNYIMSSFGSDSEEGDFILVKPGAVPEFETENITPLSVEDIRQIREWLQPSPYEEERSEFSRHLSSYLAGTGEWLTSTTTYQGWHQGHDNGLLWIKGIPGSGKSVMAASIINQLRREEVPVLYFFFRQIINANHKPIAALRDWLCQILNYSPPLQAKLKKGYLEQHRSLDSISPSDLWKNLKFALSAFPKVYCVTDALDEMDQGNDDFLHALVELGQWRPAEIKVLITSRPVMAVEIPLRSFHIAQIRLEELLVDIDIAAYVQYRLRNSSIPEEHWNVVVEAVPGRANGLFLYAKLSMDAFVEPGADVYEVLRALPADLDVMYNKLLRQHAKRSNVPDEIQSLILQFVTHATRPLRLLEIAEMVKTTLVPTEHRSLKETKDLVRAACGPLLEVLPDETVSVVHHSFTEFLKGFTRTNAANDSFYPVLQAAPTNKRLAVACLDYLRCGCLDNLEIKRRDSTSEYIRPKKSRQRKVRLQFPFLEYAAGNWYVHSNRAIQAGEDMKFLYDILNTFFADKQRLLAWLDIDWPTTKIHGLTPLHIASRTGLAEYAAYLLQQGDINPDVRDSHGDTPLYWAATSGNAGVARILLANGADPDGEAHTGLKPLHAAASNNCAEVVKTLLATGVDPLTPKAKEDPGRFCGNAPISVGHTPLMYACNYGHVGAVSEFLPYLKDVESCHKALNWAASGGHATLVSRILQHPGVDVNAKVRGDTALFHACKESDQNTIEVLLRAGADPNIICSYAGDEFAGIGSVRWLGDNKTRPRGYTAIHALCGLGRFPHGSVIAGCLDLLLKAGANVNVESEAGYTALGYAFNNNLKIVKELLEAGGGGISIHTDGSSDDELLPQIMGTGVVNINERLQDSGKTPLHCRIEGRRTESVPNFLRYKPDINIADSDGNGPLHMAVRNRKMTGDVVDALLSAGAEPNLRNKNGDTPLHVTIGECQNFASNLMNAGANLESKNHKGETPLFKFIGASKVSTLKENLEAYEVLLALGARLDTRNYKGQTLLHNCVMMKSRVERLIGLGLDPDATDYAGNTLFHNIASKEPSLDKFETMKHLFSLGLDIDKPNNTGETVLHVVCSRYFTERTRRMEQQLLEYVLSVCKNMNPRAFHGVQPLHIAASVSETYVFQLLNAGVDMFAKTDDGSTVLHIAARTRQPNVVGLVLSKLTGLDEEMRYAFINMRDSSGMTAFDYACRSGRPETVQALLEGSADLNLLADTRYSVFRGLVYFEAENERWDRCDERTMGKALNAAGILLSDKARPYRGSGNIPGNCTSGSLAMEHDTTRLDEILNLIVAHGGISKKASLNNAMHIAASNHYEYTFELVARLQDRLFPDISTVKPNNYSTQDPDFCTCKYRYSATKRALRECGRYDTQGNLTGRSIGELSRNYVEKLIGLRHFDLFEERIAEGVVDLLRPNWSGESLLHVIVRFGYKDLLTRVGSSKLASKFDDYEWCKQAECSQSNRQCHDNAIKPLLLTACNRSVPNMEVVKVLVEDFTVDVNAKSRVDVYITGRRKSVPGNGALHHLAEGCSWWHVDQALPYLIKMGADLEIRDEKGATPLHVALDFSRYKGVFYREAARVLIDGGADVNAIDTKGHTCLAKAGNDVQLIKLLLANDAQVSATAIFCAIELRQLDILKVLLSSGEVANMRPPRLENPKGRHGDAPLFARFKIEDWQKYPLLHAATYEEPGRFNEKNVDAGPIRRQMMTALLSHGADPYAVFLKNIRKLRTDFNHMLDSKSEGEYEFTTKECIVIHEILAGGNLIEPFFNLPSLELEARDADGRTLLLAASESYSSWCSKIETTPGITKTVIEELIQRGADVMAQDNMGKGILHYMTQFTGPKLDIIEAAKAIIKKTPSLIHQIDKAGDTPLHYALRRGTVVSIDLLLEHGADPLQTDTKGNTGLHHLAKRLQRNAGMFERFLDAGVDINTRNKKGKHAGMFERFLDAGVDINARNKKGNSPLFIYVKKGIEISDWYTLHRRVLSHNDENWFKDSMLEMFQEKNADFFTCNEEGTSLLHLLAAKTLDDFTLHGSEYACDQVVQLFKFLMALGLDPMSEDKRQRTSLDVAAASGNEHILKLFDRKPVE
jgi:ankyrin repeat protein